MGSVVISSVLPPDYEQAFDNSYFKNLLSKSYEQETTSAGCPQLRSTDSPDGTIMLISDMALLEDAGFKTHVEAFARDQSAFFAAYASAWQRLQELGIPEGQLRGAS